jgi:predicted RNA-binding Zn-ribbon protein involved in translation (DUF1610 family)
MSLKYKSTKMPADVMDEAELVRAKILTNIKQFNENLPQEIKNPTICPLCKNKLESFEVRVAVKYYRCSKCGYKQPGIDLQASGDDISSLAAALGIGVLAGLGIASLLYLLSKSDGGD